MLNRAEQEWPSEMDEFTRRHLENWVEQEFREEDEQRDVLKLLTQLWESDVEYWSTHSHSWWEMLEIGRRSRAERAARAMKAICKS